MPFILGLGLGVNRASGQSLNFYLAALRSRVTSEGYNLEGVTCLNKTIGEINNAYSSEDIQYASNVLYRVLGEGYTIEGYPCLVDTITSINNVADSMAGQFEYINDGVTESVITIPQVSQVHNIKQEPNFNSVTDGTVAMDFVDTDISGTTFSEADDTAPVTLYGRFLGAGHGYAATNCTATGHGKLAVDVGSIYTNGTETAVILGITSANVLVMADRDNDTELPTGTYTHVSGGTNTADIIVTTAAFQQWYPPFQNRQTEVKADGIPLTYDDTYRFRENVQVIESYDLLERSDIINWFINTSTGGAFEPSGLDPVARLSFTYTYDTYGGVVVYSTFTALREISTFNRIFFLQSGIKTGDGDTKYYIPKALPFSADSQSWDFAEIENYTTKPWSIPLDFTPSRVSASGIYADRALQLSDNYGFAMGFIPVEDATERSTISSERALQLFNTGKVYMNAVGTGATTLAQGTSYTMVGYRNFYAYPSAGNTAFYVVRTTYGNYIYFDFHNNSGGNAFTIPPDLIGKAYTVVEQGSNTSVTAGIFTDSLTISVNNNLNGYVILRTDA